MTTPAHENLGRIEKHGQEIGPVTPEMIEGRSQELAEIEGRDPEAATEEDRLHAMQDLYDEDQGSGKAEPQAVYAATGNPADPAVETGHQVKPVKGMDEQELYAQEAQEGVREAEHERMLRGQRESQSL